MTALEAAALIKDNDTVAVEGFLCNAQPDVLCAAVEERFLSTGSPKNLTLFYAAGQGDGKDAAVNHFGHETLLKRVIGGHWNLAPKLGKLAVENKIEAYNLPQGTLAQLYRDMAGGKIGAITHVGLKTFVDPRNGGGKLNSKTTEDLVELLNIGGKELLLYKSQRLNCCLLRGSVADEKGNVSLEMEGVTLGVTAIAQAVKNAGGTVIVQVNKVVKAGTLDPKLVKIPHIYVDVIVPVPLPQHMAEVSLDMIPVYCGDQRIPSDAIPPIPLDERKIIARRAAMELFPNAAVNLGIGLPEAIANVANEEGIGDYMTLTVEAGPVGGIPASGLLFGISVNPECILDQATQFDFYDGGGLDLAFLGLAECDASGNINVSKMGPRVTGCGGFINITQNAKKVFFCGSFTAKGLKIAAGDGKLIIQQEGSIHKFLQQVGHITFSGEYAREVKQPVLYITERAVFELQPDGLHLTEVAPGVDIEKDILAHMDFKPVVKGTPKLMDKRIFMDAPMGLKK